MAVTLMLRAVIVSIQRGKAAFSGHSGDFALLDGALPPPAFISIIAEPPGDSPAASALGGAKWLRRAFIQNLLPQYFGAAWGERLTKSHLEAILIPSRDKPNDHISPQKTKAPPASPTAAAALVSLYPATLSHMSNRWSWREDTATVTTSRHP